jgi:hypothetical protein
MCTGESYTEPRHTLPRAQSLLRVQLLPEHPPCGHEKFAEHAGVVAAVARASMKSVNDRGAKAMVWVMVASRETIHARAHCRAANFQRRATAPESTLLRDNGRAGVSTRHDIDAR